MPAAKNSRLLDVKRAIVETYAVNERTNQYLIEHLDDQAWRAEAPGGKGRTIAAIVAHMHNVRHMWLAVSAKEMPIPDKLNRDTCTRKQAMAGLAKSAECCSKLIANALETPDGRVKNFRPDVVGFVGYLISHDAHHRGQIALLARQCGHPLPKQVGFGMWEWGTLWKACGFGEGS